MNKKIVVSMQLFSNSFVFYREFHPWYLGDLILAVIPIVLIKIGHGTRERDIQTSEDHFKMIRQKGQYVYQVEPLLTILRPPFDQ